MLAAPEELDRHRFEQLVMESVTAVATEKVHRLCSSNRAFIAQTLKSNI